MYTRNVEKLIFVNNFEVYYLIISISKYSLGSYCVLPLKFLLSTLYRLSDVVELGGL